jgi:N-acetyl-anhydromuramyl-L-alanine amidase AmpD
METRRQTQNFTKGFVLKPRGIVLHHSGGGYVGSVQWCLNPNSKVSYHKIVNTDGNYTTIAQDNQRAWHSGKSSFKGKTNCNDFMLGFSVIGDTNFRELNKEEIETVAKLCISAMKKYGFGIDMITTHKKISPGRKTDVDSRAELAIIKKIVEWI